jgi:cation:H+ antiporter
MRGFWIALAIAMAAVVPGLALRLSGTGASPILEAALAAMAILAAGFMLSWGVEAAEAHVSRGLALAVLALITVLPEFVVEFYFAMRGGQQPGSDYVHYATANMTGANRLLVGFGWPVIVLLYWWRSRRRQVDLQPGNAVEVCFLALASAYSFLLVAKQRLDVVDAVVLVALYVVYLWRLGRLPREHANDDDDDDEEDEVEVGPGAALEELSRGRKFALMAVLGVVAATVIVMEAEPFAESLVGAASALGVNHFFLIQWVSPLAGEMPEIVIMILFTLSLRPGHALGALVSDKINQWTLLLGALPLVFSYGAGHLAPLPLGPRQQEELFLTAAQSLFAVMLLLRMRLALPGAMVLLVLFFAQVGLAYWTQNDEATTIRYLTAFAWVYIVMAIALALSQMSALLSALRFGLDFRKSVE